MSKSTYNKKNAKHKNQESKDHSKYDELLTTLLITAGLNKFEVSNRIKIHVKASEVIDLDIDLHRFTTEDTERILVKLLNSRTLNINSISLIHGFNHGIILKEYLNFDFSHERISAKINDSSNKGITILKIKPWGKNTSNNGQKIKQKAKNKNKKVNKCPNVGIEEEKNDARFKLEMIKEKVKATTFKGKKYNDEFSSILTVNEKQYSEEIFNYDFTLNFFMSHLMEFCLFEEVTYIKIRYKKKSFKEVTTLIKKLTDNSDDKKFVIIIQVAPKVVKQMKSEEIAISKKCFLYELEENKVIISNNQS